MNLDRYTDPVSEWLITATYLPYCWYLRFAIWWDVRKECARQERNRRLLESLRVGESWRDERLRARELN